MGTNEDACPGIGRHVRSTSEIGAFRIPSTSHRSGALRIRFTLKSAAEAS
jgi:Ser-tRNA(Ala) deacylase AlaX